MSSINPVKISADPAVTPVRSVRPATASDAPSAPVSAPASSQSAAENTRVVATGNAAAPLPVQNAQAAPAPEPVSSTQSIPPTGLQKQFDDLLATTRSALQFRVDDESDRLVVSVIDQDSGDVLLQIPTDVALRIAKSLASTGQGLVNVNA